MLCVYVCVCVRACVRACVPTSTVSLYQQSTLNTYCLINNASLYEGLLLFMYNHNENKKENK